MALIGNPISDANGSNSLQGVGFLDANRTYYVRTDGNDSNDGLSNSSGGAFLTIQAAVNAAYAINFNGYTVTISIGNGTYTGAVALTGMPAGCKSASNLIIKGGSGTATDVIISTTSADAINLSSGAQATIEDLQLQTTTGGNCVYSYVQSLVTLDNVFFGACAAAHMITFGGARIEVLANYTISGGATTHVQSILGGNISCNSKTVTITGTPAFSSAYAAVARAGQIDIVGNTFSGSATGVRYSAITNGVIFASGATLPGNSAGSTATGGQYV